MSNTSAIEQLMQDIQLWATEAGFADVGVSKANIDGAEEAVAGWLEKGYHGTMQWFEQNTEKRSSPTELVPGTARILSFRLNYLPADTAPILQLKKGNEAYISRYALGRDYHKLIRKRLAKLGKKIERRAHQLELLESAHTRAFVDSAPILERPIAEQAGLGWTGKHTLIINKEAGSWFFLGELFTNIPLPINTDTPENHCAECTACLKVCPTDAFPEPYTLDARRCISYLTIEHKGAIPVELREPMGNRIFGCDDCQLICPWNKYAHHTEETDFKPRHQLGSIELLELFRWDEAIFLEKTEGSAIRRTGFENWQRNLAIALGNAPQDLRIIEALEQALISSSAMVAEHIEWAIVRQKSGKRRRRKIKASA